MCGSQGLYDQTLQDGCNVNLLTNGVVKKIFDTNTTVVTTSSGGNVKLVSLYPRSTVILSDADIIGMGFADRAAFLAFWNAVKCGCCAGSVPPNPIVPQLVTVTFPDVIDNGQTLVQTGAASVVLGGNYTVIPVTDLAPLYAAGLIVSFDIVTNGKLTVTVNNLGDNDAVVIPPLSFNIYSL